MTNKHTQEFWYIRENASAPDNTLDIEGEEIGSNGGAIIARLYGKDRKANASLIAAAPELLADLERAIELLTQVYGADTFMKDAQETINKAKGM